MKVNEVNHMFETEQICPSRNFAMCSQASFFGIVCLCSFEHHLFVWDVLLLGWSQFFFMNECVMWSGMYSFRLLLEYFFYVS